MGRKISENGDRGTPGYRLERQGAIRLKRVNMVWIGRIFSPLISFWSGLLVKV